VWTFSGQTRSACAPTDRCAPPNLHRGVPWLPYRHAGQYMALATQAEASARSRKHLRKPLHARTGTGTDGRQHQGGGKHGHRARAGQAVRGSRHVLGPAASASLVLARWLPTGSPSWTASIIWTAATSALRRNCARGRADPPHGRCLRPKEEDHNKEKLIAG